MSITPAPSKDIPPPLGGNAWIDPNTGRPTQWFYQFTQLMWAAIQGSGGLIDISKGNEIANVIFAGPSSGAAASPAFRRLVGADLPTPTPADLGGVLSFAPKPHEFLTGISLAGAPFGAQPSAADLSNGTVGNGHVVLAEAPTIDNVTLTGTVTLPAQAENTVWAGPVTGPDSTPTFRLIVTADIATALSSPGPIGGVAPGAGTFTSVTAQTLSLTGSQAANTIYAAPSGSSGAPLFRAMTGADLPAFTGDATAPGHSANLTLATVNANVGTFTLPSITVNAKGLLTAVSSATTVGSGPVVLQAYVDAAIQGLSIKPTATVATTAALPANIYVNGASGVGATLTAVVAGVLTVDGVATTLGALILVKNEVTSANNGFYSVTTAGAVGVAYVLTRHTDMDQAAEFSGAFIPVSSAGTANANSLWLANPSGTVVVGTTAIPFTQLNGATDLIAGSGLTISGNTISISPTYVGQTSITTLGTITTGAWTATPVTVAFGGTGDTGTGWTAYTPTVTAGSGTFTTVSATGRWKSIGKTIFVQISITITTNGTAATNILATLPVAAGAGIYAVVGRETAGQTAIDGVIAAASIAVSIRKYDASYPGATGAVLNLSGCYESV